MKDRAGIEALIPHRGAMCLLERVLHWDAAEVVAATRTHLLPDHPLRRDGHLHAVHLCEYGAQAAALHGGLLARQAGRQAPPGMLVALRDVWLGCRHLDPLTGELLVTARLLLEDGASWHYAFEVRHGQRTAARGRAAIIKRDQGSG